MIYNIMHINLLLLYANIPVTTQIFLDDFFIDGKARWGFDVRISNTCHLLNTKSSLKEALQGAVHITHDMCIIRTQDGFRTAFEPYYHISSVL
jgi:hypothetical protein